MTTRAKCVRFEIEYEDGRVVRAASPEAAERHHRDLDSACGIAHVHGWAPVAPPEFETVRASRSSSGSGEREAANPHVMECNYRLGPIGAPGCICRVVNRALSSGERVRALEEALREARRCGDKLAKELRGWRDTYVSDDEEDPEGWLALDGWAKSSDARDLALSPQGDGGTP